jgi:short-subunit dehydrogenase
MQNVMVIGGTGFIGSNIIRLFTNREFHCISVSRTPVQNTDCDQILLTDFFGIEKEVFESMQLNAIIYALGDPNLSGKNNREAELLASFLEKLMNIGYSGRFVLISSNAANPDSGMTSAWYRRSLKNPYISRKIHLERIVESSEIDFAIMRAPAVIGIDMKDTSHIKRLLKHTILRKVMSFQIFAGTIEIIEVEDLFEEILLSCFSHPKGSIIEPSAPSYRWSRIAKFLDTGHKLEIEEIAVMSKVLQLIGILLPVSLKFLLFPHWLTKGRANTEVLSKRHQNIMNSITKIRFAQNAHKRILVTGCASGLGAAVTDLLHSRNYSVTGLDIIPMHESEIIKTFLLNPRFRYVELDLGADNSISEIERKLIMSELSGIFSIAGVGPRRRSLDTTLVEMKRIFNVNFFSPVELFKSLVKDNPSSFFCYVGSSAGIIGLPNFSSYASSKASAHSYFFSTISELSKSEASVFVLIPSGMKTNFQKSNGVQTSRLDNLILSQPMKVARNLVDWAERRDRKSLITSYGVSSVVFRFLLFLPFGFRLAIIRNLSKGAR